MSALCGTLRRGGLLFLLFFISVSVSSMRPNRERITIKEDWDLQGKTIVLPQMSELIFSGGTIKNGTLVGNNTSIKGERESLFGNVTIKGTWIVPKVSTKMFKDLSYDNSLRDVFSLTSAEIDNEVIIEPGQYLFSFHKNDESGIIVNSNTSVHLNGNLQLKPNSFPNYAVLRTKGNNISIDGSGVIIGDKITHFGLDGEWGMGVYVDHSTNVKVEGITVKDCWGDCFYVAGRSKNIIIRDCSILGGRRQGISVTSAEGVTIHNCSIRNISGTAPQFGIDIEPNAGQKVEAISITNVSISDSYGGILAYGLASSASIGSIVIENCTINNCVASHVLHIQGVNSISIIGTSIKSVSKSPLYVSEAGEASIIGNVFYSKHRNPIQHERCRVISIKENQIVK